LRVRIKGVIVWRVEDYIAGIKYGIEGFRETFGEEPSHVCLPDGVNVDTQGLTRNDFKCPEGHVQVGVPSE
jgi:hypothetical protein